MACFEKKFVNAPSCCILLPIHSKNSYELHCFLPIVDIRRNPRTLWGTVFTKPWPGAAHGATAEATLAAQEHHASFRSQNPPP